MDLAQAESQITDDVALPEASNLSELQTQSESKSTCLLDCLAPSQPDSQ